ncbi:VanZ family protein [Bacillus sp. V3B]|nr:VanZ family protein [Bacillus sp. V3B]
MVLIWMQSSHFNPESIYSLSTNIRMEILLIAGIGFELFHFFQFGILYLFFTFACLSFGRFTKGMELVLVVISMSCGLIDEIHQMYVPFRSFSVDDLFKNGIGVLVVSLIIHKSYFSSKKSKLRMLLRRIESLSGNQNRNIHF